MDCKYFLNYNSQIKGKEIKKENAQVTVQYTKKIYSK